MTSQLIVVVAIVVNAVAGYRLPGALGRYEANDINLGLCVLVMPLVAVTVFTQPPP